MLTGSIDSGAVALSKELNTPTASYTEDQKILLYDLLCDHVQKMHEVMFTFSNLFQIHH